MPRTSSPPRPRTFAIGEVIRNEGLLNWTLMKIGLTLPNRGVLFDVTTAEEMRRAVRAHLDVADAVVMAAAELREGAESELRDHVQRLISDWTLDDPNPGNYRVVLDHMAKAPPLFTRPDWINWIDPALAGAAAAGRRSTSAQKALLPAW